MKNDLSHALQKFLEYRKRIATGEMSDEDFDAYYALYRQILFRLAADYFQNDQAEDIFRLLFLHKDESPTIFTW